MEEILVIDPSISGISGDMFLSACVDLGANEKEIIDSMNSIKQNTSGVEEIKIRFKDVNKNGFRAKNAVINMKETKTNRNYNELNGALTDSLNDLGLNRNAQRFAKNALENIINAESKIHNESKEVIHLHETGSVDTLIDIIGSTIALEDLKIFDDKRIITLPVAVGGGKINFSHGELSVPAPAVLEIARENGIIIKGGPNNYETATPTGLAILSSLKTISQEIFPAIIPQKIGIGAGSLEIKKTPNILRMIIGKSIESKNIEEIVMLETNIDDLNGEQIAFVSEKILEKGANDVNILPIYGKKGRPAFTLRVMVKPDQIEIMSNYIMKETGSLGIRIMSVPRYVLDREMYEHKIKINGNVEKVNIKISKNSEGEIIVTKPEFEDLKRISLKYDIPIQNLHQKIIRSLEQSPM